MNKKNKRLSLARETIRHLAAVELGQVAAGCDTGSNATDNAASAVSCKSICRQC